MGGQRKGCSAILLREPGAGWHVCGYSPLNPAGCLGPSQLSQGSQCEWARWAPRAQCLWLWLKDPPWAWLEPSQNHAVVGDTS